MATSTSSEPVLPPLPAPDDVSRFFWEGCRRHQLLIQKCSACEHYIHPPRLVCRFCLSTELAPAEVSGRATVDTFTIPLQPYDAYFQSQVPYVLAVVELVEQKNLKLLTNIVGCDPDDVRIGMAVEVVFTDISADVTLPHFRLVTA